MVDSAPSPDSKRSANPWGFAGVQWAVSSAERRSAAAIFFPTFLTIASFTVGQLTCLVNEMHQHLAMMTGLPVIRKHRRQAPKLQHTIRCPAPAMVIHLSRDQGFLGVLAACLILPMNLLNSSFSTCPALSGNGVKFL